MGGGGCWSGSSGICRGVGVAARDGARPFFVLWGLLRRPPGAGGAHVARANDCGPEPSLRTSPSSSSSRPSAFPSDSLGRIDGARHVCTTRAGLPVSRIEALLGRGLGERFASPAQTGRAGGRLWAYTSCYVVTMHAARLRGVATLAWGYRLARQLCLTRRAGLTDSAQPQRHAKIAARPPESRAAPSGGSKHAKRVRRGGPHSIAARPPEGRAAPSGGSKHAKRVRRGGL